MSDPRMSDQRLDPRYNERFPSDRNYADGMGDSTGMIAGAIVAAVIVGGLLFYGFSGDGNQTASNPAPETPGQSQRAPAPPTPTPAPDTQPKP